MDFLHTKENRIIDGGGRPVRLRGTCLGGWMNLENFIDGYPGTEHGIRAAVAEAIGESKADFFSAACSIISSGKATSAF